MKRVKKKDPWRFVRRDFEKFFHGDGKTPWVFFEGKKDFVAHNVYTSVVVQRLAVGAYRVIVFSERGRTVRIVTKSKEVYTIATQALMGIN